VNNKVSDPEKVTLALVANKTDLLSSQNGYNFVEEVKKYIADHPHIVWVECSAKSGFNVGACIRAILTGELKNGASSGGTAMNVGNIEMEENDLVELQKRLENQVVWTFEDIKIEEYLHKGIGLLGKHVGKKHEWDSGYYKNPFSAESGAGVVEVQEYKIVDDDEEKKNCNC